LDRRRFVEAAQRSPIEVTSEHPGVGRTCKIDNYRRGSRLAIALRKAVPVPLRRTGRPVSSLARDAGSALISADAVMGKHDKRPRGSNRRTLMKIYPTL